MNNSIKAALLALTLILIAAPMQAQTIDVSALPKSIPGPPRSTDDRMQLDLATAYEMTLARNLDLQVGRYNIAAADANAFAAGGIFDPNLTFGIDGGAADSPQSTQLGGALVLENRSTRFGLGIGQLLPTGTTWQVDVGTRRAENNSQFVFVNPSWSTDLTVGITQPLLKGFGTLVNRAGIVVARNSRARTAEAFEIAVVETLRQVESAYWDLVAARRAVLVSEQSLELAGRLLDETRERVKVGTSAPIDTVQSEAGVATRRQDQITARNIASNAEDALKEILGFDEPQEWLTRIETTETYEFEPFIPDLAEAIETGLASRPEMREKRLELDILEYYERLARNDVMPSLDLRGDYGWSGIGGNVIFRDDDGNIVQTIPGGFSDSWQQVRDFDFPHWTLGVQFGIPIGNNDAQGRLAQRRFESQKAQVEMQALEQDIISQVRFAVRALEDGAAAVEAALKSRELAERNLDAEQTKFANGLSTNFQVLEIQEDLSNAQLALIRSYLDYRKANVYYRVATGTLLDFLNVDIVDPGDQKVPHDYWKSVKWLQFDDFKGTRDLVTTPAEPYEPPES